MQDQRVLFLTSETSILGQRCRNFVYKTPGLWIETEQGTVVSLTGKWDLAVSVGYRHILTPEQIALFPMGVVNLHTGYLPWNRGRFPNVWPLVDGSPAGVTVHWMDEGIDTGPIIAQKRVEVDPWDTAGSLYEKLNDAAFDLFKTWWPSILAGTAPRTPQEGDGSVHRQDDLCESDWSYSFPEGSSAEWLFNDLRSRSFPGYPGLKIRYGNQTVEARIELRPTSPPNG